MSSATTLFEHLTDDDVDWMLDENEERHVGAGETVIAAGEPVDSLFILLEGLLAVVGADGTQVDVVGPGDLVGEMSFVERETPSRSVTALEASTLAVVPHEALRARADADPAFAGRLYRALALLLSRRFRRAINELSARAAAAFDGDRERTVWEQVTDGIEQLKEALHTANREGLNNRGIVPAEAAAAVENLLLHTLYPAMNHIIGDEAPGSEQFKEQVGIRIHKELVPYILLSDVSARMVTKPRGYAGDYLTIEMMYTAEPGGVRPLGPLMDEITLKSPAGMAVRNRRALLAEEITSVVAARNGDVARITSLACGPAREVFDVFDALPDASALKATLIDFDLQALAHVAERRDALGLQRSISLTSENLIHLAVGRKSTDLAGQDLVYSIGLIDYFPDELVVKLMSLIHSLLRPGGKAILGNFHSKNPGKAYMDHVLEWRLIHRTEADMDRLYSSSAFGHGCTNIRFENEGVNMFAECTKG